MFLISGTYVLSNIVSKKIRKSVNLIWKERTQFMLKQKWISFVLCLAMLFTTFAGAAVTSYADGALPFEQFERQVSFTKADNGSTPSSVPFTAGASGSLVLPPEVPLSIVPGFYLAKCHYDYVMIFDGQPVIEPQLEFNFPTPDEAGISGNWILQKSTDGGNNYSDYSEGSTLFETDYDNFCVEPASEDASSNQVYYRLKGDISGNPIYSNAVQAEYPTFGNGDWGGYAEWNAPSMDSSMFLTGIMSPQIGCGMEITGCTVSTLSALTLTDDNYTYQWMRVNPYTYESQEINGANNSTYASTQADAGYLIMCRISGANEIGGFVQTFPLGAEAVSYPVESYVCNANDSGFDLIMESDVDFVASDLELYDYDGVPYQITGIMPIDSQSYQYHVSADLSGAASDMLFYLSSAKPGVLIGTVFTPMPPPPTGNNDSNGLTGMMGLKSPAVKITDSDTDRVYFGGDTFTMTLDLNEIMAESSLHVGDTVRVALGYLSSVSSTTIYPYQSTSSGIAMPFVSSGSDVPLTFSNTATLDGNDHIYNYSSQIIDGDGKVSISGTLADGIAPSQVGAVIVSGDGTAVLSSLALISDDNDTTADVSDDKPVFFMSDSFLPPVITVSPALSTIDDLYHATVSFTKPLTTSISGIIAFDGINLMEDYHDLSALPVGLILQPKDAANPLEGFQIGMNELILDNLKTNPAKITLTGLNSLDSYFGGQLTGGSISVSGAALKTTAAYDSNTGVLTFDVYHFSTYEVLFNSTTSNAGENTIVVGDMSYNDFAIGSVDPNNPVWMDIITRDQDGNLCTPASIGTLWMTISSGGALIETLGPDMQYYYDDQTGHILFETNYLNSLAVGTYDLMICIGAPDDYVWTTEHLVVETEDLRRFELQEWGNDTFYQGEVELGEEVYMEFYADDNQGNPCSPLSLGTLSVNVSGTAVNSMLVSGDDFIYTDATGELFIDKDYLNSLQPGKYELTVAVGPRDDYFWHSVDLYVLPKTSNITFNTPVNGTTYVYPVTWSEQDQQEQFGQAISSGDTIPVGMNHWIDLNCDTTWRIAAAKITEAYFGFENVYDTTLQFVSKGNHTTWMPWGDITIDITTEAIPDQSQWPVLEGVELYQYNEQTNRYDILVTSTMTAIDLKDELMAVPVFDRAVTTTDHAFVALEWQYQDSNGQYTDDTYVTNNSNQYFDPYWDRTKVENNYVKLTARSLENYTIGGSVELEFYVNSTAQVQTPPTSVTGQAPESQNAEYGKLLKTDSTMEYRLASATDNDYAPCQVPETLAAPGTYYVRYAATATAIPSKAVTVVVPAFANLPVAVTGVQISNEMLTMAIGQQQHLTANVLPANADNQEIIWASSNPNVVTVNNGTVSAISAGIATIAAISSDGGISATCSVTVNQNAVVITGLSIADKVYDGTNQATILGTPVISGVANGDDVTLVGIGLATFADKNAGNGKAVQVTGFILTGADASDYSLSSLNLTGNISKLELTASAIDLIKNQGDQNPTPIIQYEGFLSGETATNAGITTPTASHAATLTSLAGNYSIVLSGGSGGQNYNLHLVDGVLSVLRTDIPLTGMTLVKESTSILVGASETLAVNYTPTNASIKTISWSSDATSVATVDGNGKVTGISAGTANITAIAEDGSYEDSCQVTVQTPIKFSASMTYQDGSAIPSAGGVYLIDGAKYQYMDFKNPSNSGILPLTFSAYGTELDLNKDYTLFTIYNTSDSGITTISGLELSQGYLVPMGRPSYVGDDTVHVFDFTLMDGTTAKSTFKMSFQISGTPVLPTSIVIPTTQILATVGENQLSPYYVVYPNNATTKTVTWASSNTSVLQIGTTTGAITPIGAGSATITATSTVTNITTSAIVVVGVKITGIVQKDNQPLAGAWVYLYDGNDRLVAGTSSATNGTYSFSYIPVGNYTVRSYSYDNLYQDATDTVTVSTGDGNIDAGALNFTSQYPNQSVLTIELEDAENPGTPYTGTGDIYISVYSYETGISYYREMTDAEKATGTITFGGICYDGNGSQYDVSINTIGYWDYTSVNVTNANETVTFGVPVRYSVRGTITMSDNSRVPAYTGVKAIKDGDWNWYYGYTDESGNGTYEINGLPQGTYSIEPYDGSKYNFNPLSVTVNSTTGDVSGQNLVLTEGADLVGHVLKNGTTDVYKAYVYLMKEDGSGNYQYYTGGTAGSSGFQMDGVLKDAGDYRLHLGYISEKNGTYPMYVSNDVDFTVTNADITSGRVSQNLFYADPTNASEAFKGTGNNVVATQTLVRNGSNLYLTIKYKNNGNTSVTADFTATLPSGVTSTTSTAFHVENLAAGASGQKTIALAIGDTGTSTYLSVPVKVNIGGTDYDFGSVSLEVAGVTLQGPGAVKLNTPFKVFGEATANSTVVIKDVATGQIYATAKTSGRFYTAEVSLAKEGTTSLIAQISTSGGAVTAVSPKLDVAVTADQISLSKVKDYNQGDFDLSVNAATGVRSLMAWVDSQLNGRTISLGAMFDPNNQVSSVTYHFSGNDYAATKDQAGYFYAELNSWSGSGLKEVTATVRTTDGRALTYIIVEVTVLIDPSGIITDAETGNPIVGATVTCEKYITTSGIWTTWTTDPTQANPQLTDTTGHYGWNVEEGTYRVVATKTGYTPFRTTDSTDANINTITILPVRTDIDFAMIPSVAMASIILNHDTLDMTAGNTAQLTATANPSNATNKDLITWESSNTNIATVNAAGVVTAKAAGNVTITAVFDRDTLADLTAACSITVSAVTTGNTGSTSTSGGGGGGGVGVKLPTAPEAQNTAGRTVVSTTVEGKTLNGKTTMTVPVDSVATMLESAKKAEAAGQKSVMEFAGTGASGSNQVVFDIPNAALKQIATESKADVMVKSDLATLTFDQKAVETVNGAGSGDVSINISKVDTTNLSNEVKAKVGDRPVYDFSVKTGNTTVSQFGGNVTVSVPYTLQAGEDADAIVVYYVNSTGELEPMRGHYSAATGTVDFVTDHFSQYAVGYNKVAFADVSNSAWYNDAVTFMAARGITTGTSEGVFSPNANLTRGQFLTMILRAYGIDSLEAGADNFLDAGNTYYTGYLAAAKALGISNGNGNGSFLPNQAITRQDMFVLLYRTLDVLGEIPAAQVSTTIAAFQDSASVSSYAAEAMNALVGATVVSGSNGKLDPKGASTRAQMAQVLYNLLAE